MYMGSKEKAAEIRKDLKAIMGVNSREVSVKSSVNSISIHIKNLNIDIKTVETIANQYEDIRRCEASGEILQGGNTFVFVEFDHDAVRQGGEGMAEIAESWYLEARNGEYYGIEMAENDDYSVTYWPDNEAFPIVKVSAKNGDYSKSGKYAAHNLPHLAQAMALIAGQYGIQFEKQEPVMMTN